jgi:hypothetical protein
VPFFCRFSFPFFFCPGNHIKTKTKKETGTSDLRSWGSWVILGFWFWSGVLFLLLLASGFLVLVWIAVHHRKSQVISESEIENTFPAMQIPKAGHQTPDHHQATSQIITMFYIKLMLFALCSLLSLPL